MSGAAYVFVRSGTTWSQQIVFQIAVVRQTRLRLEVQAHLDVLKFHFQRLGETGQPAQGTLREILRLLIPGQAQQGQSQLRC